MIVRGISDKMPEAMPLILKTLSPILGDQNQKPAGSTPTQLEQHVIDKQLVLILRPAPADLFAFAQKLKCGAIKEIDIQKRIITVETELPQLMALAQNGQAGNPGMDSDVKVSANSESLKNMKSESTTPAVGNQPEKPLLPKSTIGTDRDLKPRPGEETIDWALRVISGSSSFAHDTACKKLAKMEPDPENLQRVSAILAATLPLAKEGFRMPEHVNVMAVWYTDGATREFAKLLENEKDFLVREKIIRLLPTIHSETMAEVLVGRLSDREDRKDARRALQIMGEIAEKPVLQLLNDPDSSLRIEACNVLQSIGTEEAVTALKQRAETEDNAVVKTLLVDTQAKIEKKSAGK
ncbi:hypothetical protein Pan153_60280 [Gimesia panareensis]|uniref:HEAT repeat protein n=1 Tax=Gimesia panareensis TaxID=2527978 RepID=A0A518FYI8_9PLAN|nr:hypothetical protein Pan153_60280 [Gimesia panareensis]